MATSPDDQKYKLFTRRAGLISGGMLVLTSGLIGRLYYLQVVGQDQYKLLADKNRISFRLLAPERGKILDRNGYGLAINRTDYRVNIIPEQTDNVEKTLEALNLILPISERQKRKILRAVKRQRAFLPVTVAENLDWETFARVNINIPDLPGIQPDMGITRFYPEKDLLAHIVGYVSSVNVQEIGEDPLLELPGFKIGKNGMERILDRRLRGKAGNSRVEVNVMGRVIRELSRQDSVAGDTLNLTIDRDIQKFTADRVRDESAAVVVMDVHSGEILALTSTPAFDPNDFNLGISQKKYDVLLNDARKPLINKTVQGEYPPGSTFKMIVALAALEAGVIDANEKIFCNSKYQIGNSTKHCWKRRGHGAVSMVEAIAGSCDVYFYEIAGRVGIDRIHDMAARFGLGNKFGIAIPGERKGLNPSKGWKMANRGQRWQGGDTANVGIGQGDVLVTPLQLCVMMARLVNGGRAVMPKILLSDQETASEEPEVIAYNRRNMDIVLQGMSAVINKPIGVAFAQRMRQKDMSFGGKTGSAQVRRISKKERDVRVRKNEEKPWVERDHALFVGFGPLENPRYAISVIVEHGGGGATKAAPIARDVLEFMFGKDKQKSASVALKQEDNT
ncbi:MAG: penicillin-binding protein 2 [Alphaproteobacteria bacterium]|nr:MAG: penicillin-binding protein 2 [Alphaproteobacteria bacterium]